MLSPREKQTFRSVRIARSRSWAAKPTPGTEIWRSAVLCRPLLSRIATPARQPRMLKTYDHDCYPRPIARFLTRQGSIIVYFSIRGDLVHAQQFTTTRPIPGPLARRSTLPGPIADTKCTCALACATDAPARCRCKSAQSVLPWAVSHRKQGSLTSQCQAIAQVRQNAIPVNPNTQRNPARDSP